MSSPWVVFVTVLHSDLTFTYSALTEQLLSCNLRVIFLR